MRKAKGQILVFEQVIVFGIGVAIFAASFALFVMYQNQYSFSTGQDQLTGVREYLVSSIIKTCGSEAANSSYVLAVPRTIGGSLYKIALSPAGLNLTLESGGSDFSPLYGLNETFEFSGMVVSDLGKIVIYKSGKAVFLDRKT